MSTPPVAAAPSRSNTPNPSPSSNPPASNSPATPGKRGRRPGQEIKARPDVPSGEMILVPLRGKSKADRRRKREERKGQQKEVDQLVYDIFEANVENGFERGTIADWPDLEVYDWPVSKTHAENVEFMIRKSCLFYHRKPIWGEQVEIKASESHMIEDPENEENEIPCHLNGREHIHIPFSVVRRAVRQTRD